MNENAAPVAAPKPARSARPTLDQAAAQARVLLPAEDDHMVAVAAFGSSV